MARTFKQVYDSLIAEKNTMSNLSALQPNIDSGQTLLEDLTTNSKVSRWRLHYAIFAMAIVTLENLQDAFFLLINSIVADAQAGTPRWYKTRVLEFQYGDSLTLVNNKFIYSPVNTANKIISQCAIVDGNPVVIKVAKTVSGVLAPLAGGEVTALNVYVQQIKFAGTYTNIASNAPDELALNITAYYDPLVIDATGQLISSPGTYPLNDAITNYLKQLEFNGDLVLTKLVDQLQLAEGIVNPVLNSASARIGINPFVAFTVKYGSVAGYMILNGANTTITYLPNV